MEKENESLLIESLKYFNVDIDNDKIEIFKNYLAQIIFFNEFINITSIVQEKEIIIKHFVDSISSILANNFDNQKIIDIGTGSAGFPGVPLKIVFPELKLTLVESSVKKSELLRKICKKINLEDVIIVNNNVEKTGREEVFREKFDIVVTRAVGKINILVEYGIPLLKVGGKLIIYKGQDVDKEVENSRKSLYELKSKITKNVDIILPFSEYKRKIIVVEKLGITDIKYPRRVGLPKKKPI